MLLNIIFRWKEILLYFRSCDLEKTNPFSHHLPKYNFIQNLDSNEFFKISSHNLQNVYNNV